MPSVELETGALNAAAGAMAACGPVTMLNLVRYRAQADYAEATSLPPCSGREAYLERYAPAFAVVAAKLASSQYTVVMLARVNATLVGAAGEAWDDIAIVEYPSFDILRRIIESPEYQADAAPHRRAALADWRFIATTSTKLG